MDIKQRISNLESNFAGHKHCKSCGVPIKSPSRGEFYYKSNLFITNEFLNEMVLKVKSYNISICKSCLLAKVLKEE